MQILIPASAKLTIDCCDHHVTVGGFVTDTNGNTANFSMNSIPAAPTAFVESGGNDLSAVGMPQTARSIGNANCTFSTRE
jgi:hypothetical protein